MEEATYGMPVASLEQYFGRHVGPGKRWATRKDAAVSVLSDAQECLAAGMPGHTRKMLNRAKWLLAST